MVNRHGPKIVLLLGSLFLGGGLILCSFTQTWWQFYIFFGVIAAAGVGATGWVPNTTIIQDVFKVKRGLAMGIISSGIGVGILVCVPIFQLLIIRLGWRKTYQIMAFFIPLIIVCHGHFIFEETSTTKLPSRYRGPTPFETKSRILSPSLNHGKCPGRFGRP